MAAGKSTVAQALAETFEKSVHLRGDLFRRMIVRGQAEMSAVLGDEAQRQLRLRYTLAEEVARQYLAAGFTVIYQDIFLGEGLTDVIQRLRDLPLTLFVLCPSVETVAQREEGRGKRGYAHKEEIALFDRILREQTPRLGHWLDTTHLTVMETVGQILHHLSRENT